MPNKCISPNSLVPLFDVRPLTTSVDTNGGQIAPSDTKAYSRVFFNTGTQAIIIGIGEDVDTSNPLMIIAAGETVPIKFDDYPGIVGQPFWGVAVAMSSQITVWTTDFSPERRCKCV